MLRGKDGIRQAFPEGARRPAGRENELATAIFEDDVLFIEWTARTARAASRTGIDTFIFRDGRIRLQTVRYTVVPN